MKNILIILFCTIFCLSQATAQGLQLESAGVKAGINFFNIGGNDTDGTSSLVGFHLGGFGKIPLVNTLSFNPEVIYSLNRYEDVDFSGDVKAIWSYLDLPLMVVIQTDQVTPGLSFHAGPQIGFLLTAKLKGTNASGTEIDSKRNDFVKGSNFSFGFGAGYALPVGLQFTVRYLVGLSKVGETPDGEVFDVKTSSFQISAVYPLYKN